MALNTATKIGLGTVLAGAIGYLVFSDTGEGVLEYVYADKVVSSPERYEGRTIKVHGTVVEGTIKKKKETSGDYHFVIHHEGQRLAVHFTNIPPDTFQEGGEVILTGKLTQDGTLFESDEMSAKCPSKYEEEQTVQQPPTREG
jgi:cytochrome c-type biogenesis protein CcmE